MLKIHSAEVDLNLVMTDDGRFIEIQGTAEKEAFSSDQLASFLTLGKEGISTIIEKSKDLLAVAA